MWTTLVHRGALILLLCALAASACGTLSNRQNPFVLRASLEAEEASRLVLAEGEVIRRVGGERRDTIEGFQPSFVGAVYGVQVAQEEVLTFYDRELQRLGWRSEGRDALSSGELRVVVVQAADVLPARDLRS